MPNQRIKTDHYDTFGGVNTKASVYLTGPREVLSLFNYDGSIVGDLTGRPGSTQYFSATFGGSIILWLSEYTKLNGYSKIITAHPGGMWLGQDNSVSGISLGNMTSNQTLISIAPITPVQAEEDAANFYQLIPNVTFGPRQWDFSTFVDHEFFADGRSYLKFNGTTQTRWGLPDVIFGASSIGFTTGPSAALGISPGFYYFGFAYLNERGFLGPVRVHPGAVVASGDSRQLFFNITFAPTGYGITALAIFSYFSAATVTEWQNLQFPFGRPTLGTQNVPISRPVADERLRLLSLYPTGTTFSGWLNTAYRSNGDIPNNYVPFGQTNYITQRGPTGIVVVGESVVAPSTLELFKDTLFWTLPNSSSVYFSDSDLVQAEGWQPEWEFEFRTNDGDSVKAIKAYGNRMVVGKELSLHELTGDDPENFFTREISDDYGILNNRACCTWEGRFWFLDRKGVAEYTGGVPKIVSEKAEQYFKRMNLTAARETAEMCYMKNRDEVWTLIPIDGASINNLLVIYNTASDQWYYWDGPNISKLAKLIGRMGQETSFFGDYQNRVNTFGTSFFGDNGQGFTSLVKFRYENPMGNSVEKLFRKMFVNADSLAGNATLGIDVKLRANYGSSAQVGTTMAFTSFQDDLQFGIPAKSLSVEIAHFSAVDSIRLHGYALEHRWLRNS